ncbi:MAG: head GIN domain-containing protein [Flavobacteriales bacterium]
MRNLILLPAIFIGTLSFASACDHVKGTGEVVKKVVSVENFHGITVEGAIDVVLTQSSTRSVEVEAQANIAELLTTEVRNGVWFIGTGDKSYSTDKTFTVHISVPTIDMVSIEGSGDVKGNGTFAADKVDLDIQGSGNITLSFTAKSIEAGIEGSGDMKLSGTCATFKAQVEGSGDISANGLVSANVNVAVEGSGDVAVVANESLEASVAGSGDVTYKGNPSKISRDVSGSGEIRSIESLAR